eukprot:CAMPEP_0169146222 /NCGR_PEP_ID=MMETSP1015-20121227/47411_1 /TAXON_ID=342587 /ORGANISM="Karlodinium micrum, Strain CCMP2283" /LENGTH=68 /DNA_ID=CAMNT_0009214027 /DNA_START=21 /DNA_END=224 /DNA_ORIENTATION=+
MVETEEELRGPEWAEHGYFDGKWLSGSGQLIAEIVGTKVSFADGSHAELESRAKFAICMMMGDDVFAA